MHDHHDHDQDPQQPHLSPLQRELLEHAPFSVSAVAIGLVIAGVICYLSPANVEAGHHHDGETVHFGLFHLLHPVHMFFSAAATTAMFWRYDRTAIKAIIVGLIGAVGVCGLSDIGVPHIALLTLGKEMPLHICVYEHPGLVLPFAVVGVAVGLAAARGVAHSTLFGHSLHVLASSMASIFYLIAPMGRTEWFGDLGRIFIFMIVAVMIPCCLSDVVFPMFLTKEARAKALQAGHHH